MLRLLPIAAAVFAWTFTTRERRRRQGAERLGAATLETLLNTIDANDAATGAHVRRVAEYALVLADAAGLDERACRNVERVALFHDIGKIHEALFDILHDADKLTEEERRAVRTHPGRGADVLEPLDAFYPDLRDGVLAHHERWDGTGYPRGLRGEQIPFSARVVALADSFDAITVGRRYDRSESVEAALEAIAAGRGTQFDPTLTDLFLSPPVLSAIRKAGRQVHSTPRRGARRAQRKAGATPDIKFRWRSGGLVQLPRESQSRKSR